MRPVGEAIEGGDEEDVMVADLSVGGGSRRPAGLFPAARGAGSGLSREDQSEDGDRLFGDDAEEEELMENDAEVSEGGDIAEEEVEVLEEGNDLRAEHAEEEGRVP